MQLSDDITAIWQAGVDAVGGDRAVAAALAGRSTTPTRILAVGKAATPMAAAACAAFPGVPALIVTKDGHSDGAPAGAEIIEAAHPVPDQRSVGAGQALTRAVAALRPGDHLLLLVSGGASALAEHPAEGQTLEDLIALNTRLLGAGLDITAMNAERRKLSRIKGGGLLSGFGGASVTVLAISDVPGDDIDVIGSGIGAAPAEFAPTYDMEIVASNKIARNAAQAEAQARGWAVHANAEPLHADISTLATQIGARIRDMPKGALILGGEPTVHLPPNPGRGGRNQALALELARQIEGRTDLTVLVGGTDGTDGPTAAAGGLVTGATWQPDGAGFLQRADSGSFLEARTALFTTGPTGTNVMDLLIALRA